MNNLNIFPSSGRNIWLREILSSVWIPRRKSIRAYRDGRMYTRSELQAYDHDFPSFAEGTVIPHSLYDLQLNVGYVQAGTSRDTGESACDSFRHWRYTYGQKLYPNATSIPVLCDGGGNAVHYIFKQDLQSLADEIKVEIRIAHYPPYCSKYNPIEHRLFPHMTRACRGVIFTSLEMVTELISKTRTEKGLKVFVHVLDKIYKTGRKAAKNFKKEMRIVSDNILPKWNYCSIPSTCQNDQVILDRFLNAFQVKLLRFPPRRFNHLNAHSIAQP